MEIFVEVEQLYTIFTCRCCLAFSNEPMERIFECAYGAIAFHEIIKILAPISIEVDDGFSQFICDICKETAIEAYKFRQTCIDSANHIRSEIENKTDVYDEVIHEETEIANEYQLSDIDEQVYERKDSYCEDPNEECSQESFQFRSEPSPVSSSGNEDENEVSIEEDHEVLPPLYICNVCDQVFKSQEILASHLNEHQNQDRIEPISSRTKSSRKYECNICGKRFETPSKLHRHMIVHRDVLHPSVLPERRPKVYKYICPTCEKLFETPSKLQRHLRVHKNRPQHGINMHRPYSCSHCDMRFWDKVKLQRHLIIHSEAFHSSKIAHPEDYLFTCVICLEKIPNYEECMLHMRNHRNDCDESKGIACKLCPKVYPKIVNLIRHSKVHEENATHQCIHCGRRMGFGDDLIDHFLRHENFKPFVCDMPLCGKKFVKIHKLRHHMETHMEPKSFACNQCDKSFSEREYLNRHLMRHSGRKDHACHICQARFTFKSGLSSHMTTHTNTEKSFECNLCPSKFTQLSSLRTHQKIHTGNKKFVCEICNMRFITSGHLKRHKVTHNGIKQYSCQYCSKSYTQSNDLIKHLRSHLGPNVYKCDIDGCSEAFPKFGDLKSHKMNHYSASEMLAEDAYEGGME